MRQGWHHSTDRCLVFLSSWLLIYVPLSFGLWGITHTGVGGERQYKPYKPWSQDIHCRMFSLRYLLVSSAILTIIGVTYAKVITREESQVQFQEVELDRKRINQKCSGYAPKVCIRITFLKSHSLQNTTGSVSCSRTRSCLTESRIWIWRVCWRMWSRFLLLI